MLQTSVALRKATLLPLKAIAKVLAFDLLPSLPGNAKAMEGELRSDLISLIKEAKSITRPAEESEQELDTDDEEYSSSSSDPNSDVQTFQRLVSQMTTFTRCLVDLGIALDCPAKDPRPFHESISADVPALLTPHQPHTWQLLEESPSAPAILLDNEHAKQIGAQPTCSIHYFDYAVMHTPSIETEKIMGIMLNEELTKLYDMEGIERYFTVPPQKSVSHTWAALGIQHILYPSEDVFACPGIPVLTSKAFVRWVSLRILLDPNGHVPLLQNVVQEWPLRHPDTGQPFPVPLPRKCFPSDRDTYIERWCKDARPEACGISKAPLAASRALGLDGPDYVDVLRRTKHSDESGGQRKIK
ncbi:hypothetical protein PG985_013169 [Apiospora marii]|uniref:uncharacterized protein n=1 Tax=Apiospora marii TaxID=335849 RepID=UPI0031322D73